MDRWIERLSKQKGEPRLWFERLVLFSESDPSHSIRTIMLRPGLNLIWAHEPGDRQIYRGVHAAGHGVGKTSLCLVLRYCLGDHLSASVAELRDTLHGEFPQGGVGAVIHLEGECFAVFRYFNPHREGMVRTGCDLEKLLRDGSEQSFREFEAHLSKTMMERVSPRAIPETGQTILWQHLLAWIARDQGARFKSFYAWRDGEGTGLQRSRQDPPIVMRAVLGLLERGEFALLTRIRGLEHDLEASEQETARLRQEPELIRKRIESEVRTWLDVPPGMPLRAADFFTDSLEKRIHQAEEKAAANLAYIDKQIESLGKEWVEAQAEYLIHKRAYDEAEAEYQRCDSARESEESAFAAIRDRMAHLKRLSGRKCEEGEVDFGNCNHIQEEIRKLESAIDMKARRVRQSLAVATEDWTARSVRALERRDRLRPTVDDAKRRVTEKERQRKVLQGRRNLVAADVARGERLHAELDRWTQSAGSKEADDAIATSVARSREISRKLDSARTELAMREGEKSDREHHLSGLVNALACALLSDEAFGWFSPRDEDRPFGLDVRRGEAFKVMEVLLGDLACLLDTPASAFPGLLIHDCPREADMGPHLYEDLLLLVERVQRDAYGDSAPFQYIVTTTTPPPESLRRSPHLRETLDPSTDDGLLFRRRFRQPTRSESLPRI